ncbi:MAG: DNA topoisomerase IV subunit A, partial [Candidatus Aenigmarchaeota archaeon]|nr:DNA topoisomerase IV subunit A [Candidatus Aenigmarchaeota archaeon]
KQKLIMLGNKVSHRTYLNVAHTRKFMQTLMVASECKKIIDQEVTISIRHLYYALKRTIPDTNENTFENQGESDPIIEDIEVTLNTLREKLHLKADRKGYLAGPLIVKDMGDTIDASRMGSSGWAIPSNVEPENISLTNSGAEYVLVIEKDAVWQRLNEDKFWKKNKCIIMTGKGQPDRGTRRMINRLHNEFKLPVYVLTDADVWGYYIYSVIKQGSINLSFLSDRLGTPEARFVGLTTHDVEKFGIPKNVTIKLNKGDIKRANDMLKYVWFKPKAWQEEIRHMLQVGYKLELEALSSKGIRFISEKYLPQKLAGKDFLP